MQLGQMRIPANVIANADDLGLRPSVNQAILYCFREGYINSTSFLTNTDYFDETVKLIKENGWIQNIGVHVNLAEGKPVTDFNKSQFLTEDGDWDINKVGKTITFLNKETKKAFAEEINGQIEKAFKAKITITHLDSHYHLHTLPAFYQIFLQSAKQYKLKLRLAQTYNQGQIFKYLYRKYLNAVLKSANCNYSDCFETVDRLLRRKRNITNKTVEIMLHPDFNENTELIDHYDCRALADWVRFLKN